MRSYKLFVVATATSQSRPLPAIDAEFPNGVQLRPAPGAVLGGKILAAVRAVRDGASFGQSSAAELAPLGGIQSTGHDERRSGRPPVPVARRVPAGVLCRDSDAQLLQRVGCERDSRFRVIAKGADVGMGRLHFFLESILHRLVGAHIPLFA